jgi:magnesium chelatase subunit H
VKITAFYVGTSLLLPLKQAEQSIARDCALNLSVAAHNMGAALTDEEWDTARSDFEASNIIFVFHVVEGENSARLVRLLSSEIDPARTIIVINCMSELIRCTRMGSLRLAEMFGGRDGRQHSDEDTKSVGGPARRLFSSVSGWMTAQTRARKSSKPRNHAQYLRYIERMPSLLRFLPAPGRLRHVKHYLNIFCYFLQPTPNNVRSMLLYAMKYYAAPDQLGSNQIKYDPPETLPSTAIYHPDAGSLFNTFDEYSAWHRKRVSNGPKDLHPSSTIGLLLMRPQIVSKSRKHYDGLIRAIEREGLAVIPAISTFMDNRESCRRFFVQQESETKGNAKEGEAGCISRVCEIVSLTGFSFVGGPAMNDSEAAVGFLRGLNIPFRSIVSLDMQSIGKWSESGIGLNPVQAGMQVAIPEIDGATEPFIYGGMPDGGTEPVALEERCERIARRLRRWNRLRNSGREQLKIALLLFCFPPDKGNIGTAADLDVFPSVMALLQRLQEDGYSLDLPAGPDALREALIGGNSDRYGAAVNVAYSMTVEEYRRLCPHVEEIEREWGIAPGQINTFGGKLLIHGIQLGNVFIGVQPSFGYEGDPMRMMMARSGAPHHGFMALYTYLQKVLNADAVVHVGTHGALEFMPGKQVGLSESCWPDRLIGELPNLYIYSVNNPSEGTIAKRRSYAELVSYLTPPIENAGLYRDLESLKSLIQSYRLSRDEAEKEMLFGAIQQAAEAAHFRELAL